MTIADMFNVGSELRMPPNPDGTPGPVYVVKSPTIYQQGEFQRWLEQRAHDAVERSSASESAKDRRHALIDRDAALGKYEWDGPLAIEALMTSPAAMAKFLQIICRDQLPTEERAEEVLRHHVKEIATKILVRAAADPKARRELALGLAALGLPMDWMASAESELFSSSSSTPRSTEPLSNSEGSATTSSSPSTPSSEAPMG